MLKHGVAKRFAMFMLSLPGVGKSTFRVIITFGAITALLSAFVSNTATVAMLLPTAIGILTVIAKLMQSIEQKRALATEATVAEQTLSLGHYQPAVDAKVQELNTKNFTVGFWDKQADLWVRDEAG